MVRLLQKLTKKVETWIWGKEEQAAFKALKNYISLAPMMELPKSKPAIYLEE